MHIIKDRSIHSIYDEWYVLCDTPVNSAMIIVVFSKNETWHTTALR